jgi:hypothetical protein
VGDARLRARGTSSLSGSDPAQAPVPYPLARRLRAHEAEVAAPLGLCAVVLVYPGRR